MYYFGTNLENRFSVPGFWPTQEQSHKIPYERDEIRAEIERHQRMLRERRTEMQRESERAKEHGHEQGHEQRQGQGQGQEKLPT
ncbi:putative cytochrome c oxidase assembly factor protein [Cladophialophora carrionii]|uniref:Putative cytochrome c oxidase assembly factor protein n=1 Tax=Cladophialophora carrionii TaxID=86049 RepID=A0A1C1D220_9EURO|nr:putative cytochrome c oxidase assembly factor protein [Cladophialophora carrionii]